MKKTSKKKIENKVTKEKPTEQSIISEIITDELASLRAKISSHMKIENRLNELESRVDKIAARLGL